ncbi:MAG TPA: hypothetical protein VJL31_13090 [Gemmatimonadales bacterium]|nr:hypothetical protein [Gemmatimonadales bacterium]
MKCNHDLTECACPDLAERLGRAIGGGHLVVKWCSACDKSYHQCRCTAPQFYNRYNAAQEGEK